MTEIKEENRRAKLEGMVFQLGLNEKDQKKVLKEFENPAVYGYITTEYFNMLRKATGVRE